MRRALILAAFLALTIPTQGCTTLPAGQIIRGGPAPQPEGHRKLCAEQPGSECPKPAPLPCRGMSCVNVKTAFMIVHKDNDEPIFAPLVCSTVVVSFLDESRRAVKDCKWQI